MTVLPCWRGFFSGVSILSPPLGKKSEAFDPKPATASTKSPEIFGGFCMKSCQNGGKKKPTFGAFWRNFRKKIGKKVVDFRGIFRKAGGKIWKKTGPFCIEKTQNLYRARSKISEKNCKKKPIRLYTEKRHYRRS